MIKYKLICNDCNTKFDSWFASSNEYEKLKSRLKEERRLLRILEKQSSEKLSEEISIALNFIEDGSLISIKAPQINRKVVPALICKKLYEWIQLCLTNLFLVNLSLLCLALGLQILDKMYFQNTLKNKNLTYDYKDVHDMIDDLHLFLQTLEPKSHLV